MRKLPYVHRFEDRHGHVRHYFRRPGFPRVSLPGVPGTRDFMAAYDAAMRGEKPPMGASRTEPGTFDALVVLYYQSAEFKGLALSTRTSYRNLIEGFRAENGKKRLADFTREDIRQAIAAKYATPAQANNLLKKLHLLFTFAANAELLTADPTKDVKNLKYRATSHTSWTDEDIARFRARYPEGSRERSALALLLYTGQRLGDVASLGWHNLRPGALVLRQQKTGTELSIPLHPEALPALFECPVDAPAFLMTEQGHPFTVKGLGNWFNDATRAAGLPKLTAHGLRHAVARRLAEAGCSLPEIAAITGHKNLRELETYLQDYRRAQGAKEAIRMYTEAFTKG